VKEIGRSSAPRKESGPENEGDAAVRSSAIENIRELGGEHHKKRRFARSKRQVSGALVRQRSKGTGVVRRSVVLEGGKAATAPL